MRTGKLSAGLRVIAAIAAKDIVDAIKNTTTLAVIIGTALMALSSQTLPLIMKLSPTNRVIIYDAGNSQLIKELGKNQQIRLRRTPSQRKMEDDLGEASGTVLGLAIPANFDQVLQKNDPVELDGYFAHWVSRADAAKKRAFFEDQLTQLAGKPVRINVAGHSVYPRPDAFGHPFMVSLSLALAIIIVCAFLVPYLMIEEKETHTLDVLLVSPASIGQVVIGKALAGCVYGLAASGVILAFNRALVVHWEIAALAVSCGALFAVALGLLLGTLFDNPQNLNFGAGMIFMALLAPVFLTLTSGAGLPGLLKTIMPWIPSVALEKVFRISFSGSVPMGELVSNLTSIAASAAPLLAAVVWTVRRSDR